MRGAVRYSVAAGMTLMAGQAAWAKLRSLPSFDGFDTSGVFGAEDLPPLRIVVLGDSVVTGPGLDHADDAWPRIVARELANRFRVELISLAEGGARSSNILEQQVPQAERLQPDLAIVSAGSNDMLGLVPVPIYARNLDAIVERLTPVSRRVLLFGVGDIGSIPRAPFPVDRMAAAAGHVADWVQRWVAGRHGAAKIDQWALTTEAFNSGQHMFADDLFHPSAIGHRAWAESVMVTLRPMLDEFTSESASNPR